ncbi:MAG: hypothetical protein Q4G67_00065 [Actinomycetia bacterium]|nr:hypothetical protein [Actinomycetes bacterium]
MAMTPLMWFAGSSLPLSPSVPRIQDNLPVHTVAGIAVWLLFVAALVDVAERQRESR